MRIYGNMLEAFREVERDLWEMGIDVHPQTMQDKVVADNPDYLTKELRGYGFKIINYNYSSADERNSVNYILTGKLPPAPQHPELEPILSYIGQEIQDRTSMKSMNPGNSWKHRPNVWTQFLHDGKFAYTYSERITPQIARIIHELDVRPESRQAIINLHSNICPVRDYVDPQTSKFAPVESSVDLQNMGGHGRIPCSMYYQFLRRMGKLEIIYCMRSCDFLVHFPVDISLALRMQRKIADSLNIDAGSFTYFTGSLHAYAKDMKKRGIF